jgi:hypothetical protein
MKELTLSEDYIDGMRDMYNIIRAIYELPVGERVKKYRSADVATILDRFDFQQLRLRNNIPTPLA